MTKISIVEISDILKDDSLIGKSVEVRDVVVTEYDRGYPGEDDTLPYNGTIQKDNSDLRFEGIEHDIGIDGAYIHSQEFGYEIDIKGEICLNEQKDKYLRVIDVYPSLWR